MILDLRPDESLFEAGAAREVKCVPWKKHLSLNLHTPGFMSFLLNKNASL